MGYGSMDKCRCSFCGQENHNGKKIRKNNNNLVFVKSRGTIFLPSCLYGKHVKIIPLNEEEVFKPRGELEFLRKENRRLKQKLQADTARYKRKIKELEEKINELKSESNNVTPIDSIFLKKRINNG